jgi:hypothetical protein
MEDLLGMAAYSLQLVDCVLATQCDDCLVKEWCDGNTRSAIWHVIAGAGRGVCRGGGAGITSVMWMIS